MGAQYNPAEAERLIAEARAEILHRRTATRCDSCGGLIIHRSEHWLAPMADQLEAARDEVSYWRAEADRLARAANQNQAEVDRMRPVFAAAVRWRNEKARMASHLWGLEDQSLYETAGKIER